jgi:hypothetical protein
MQLQILIKQQIPCYTNKHSKYTFRIQPPHLVAVGSSFLSPLPPLIIPVLLAAIKPTFCPGGANLLTVEG